jgi:hypothetical protein
LEDLGPKDRQRLATAVETECASITRTEEDGVVILRSRESSAPASPFTGASVAKISLRDRAMVWFGQAAASLHKSPPLLFVLCANWGSAAWTGLVIFAKATTPKLKVWWRGAVSKAGAVMKRERKLAKPASPAFPKTSAVQVELSLDRVKVIRNDLTDADLEVVPAKTRVVAASTPSVANAEAKRPEPEWQKVSLEMFRAEKS